MSGYQPPSQGGASFGTQGGNASSNVGAGAGAMTGAFGAEDTRMQYQCGDCGSVESYKVRQSTRCPACGGRVLYKLRTKRMIQFEAR